MLGKPAIAINATWRSFDSRFGREGALVTVIKRLCPLWSAILKSVRKSVGDTFDPRHSWQ